MISFRHSIRFLLFFALFQGIVQAQNTLPPLEATPSVVAAGASLTLCLPPNAPPGNWRIGIFEAGQTKSLSETSRVFVAGVDGRSRATIAVQAEPGAYEFRLLSNDKQRAFLSGAAPVFVSGVRREAGAWMFNGSPFITEQVPNPLAAPGAPLFLMGLQRGAKAKLPLSVPTSAPVGWNTIALPTLEEIAAPNFDFGALQTRLAVTLATEKGRGGAFFVGFSVRLDAKGATSVALEAPIKRLRGVLESLAPGAALILSVEGAQAATLDNLNAVGAFFDAIVLDGSEIWPLKIARRLSEEQPNYDLPIFVRFSGQKIDAQADSALLDAFQSGATGLILPNGLKPSWAPILERNGALFSGAVTLEDAAILPAGGSLTLFCRLRAAGRIPLLGRLPDDKNRNGEPLFALLDAQTSAATLDGLRTAAQAGATIYLEGLPDLQNADLAKKLTDLTGCTFAANLKAGESVLRLQEPWIFGRARGLELPVEQTGTVTLTKSLAAQTRDEKGKDVQTGPRIVAPLNDGSPGVVVNGLGKGRVVWLPHAFTAAGVERAAPFDAAIAGLLQSSLVKWTTPEGAQPPQKPIFATLRATRGNVSILGLFNPGPQSVKVEATLRGNAKFAVDLSSEAVLPVTARGFSAKALIQIPANGWSWTAWAESKEAFEKERNTPRLRAKLQ